MKNYLEYYYSKYPKSTIQDYIKLIYQMVFGSGHMIENPAISLNLLKKESLNLEPYKYEDLYEFIGYEFVRINLRPYNKYKLSLNLLNEIFTDSANIFITESKSFDEELLVLKTFLIEKNYQEDEINNYFNNYKSLGYPILNHSDIYKEEYKPAYRIVHKSFLTEEIKFYQVKHFLDQFKENIISFIAIDGNCCSGKTSLSNLIEKEYDATIIHVDDFFDTNNSTIGINSQRIIDEVFNQIAIGKPLTYRKWDCKNKVYQHITIDKVSPLVIFEGVYSANELLSDKYHGIIFLDIDYKVQIERLTIRSKPLLHKFINEWIPRENRYFDKYRIRFKADLIV